LLNEYTRVMVFSFVCSMNEKHHLDYVVLTNNSEMIKIGQYPSIADLSFPELLEFKQVIDKESIREFRTALGLFAHGIGIGSYVYLRRIFESIINIVAREYIESGLIDKNDYEKMHMDERIKFLKTDLPETIADNPVIYKIISKGIHEMSEEECKAYFPVLKDCIYLIIEQWERIRTENETKRQLERSIQDISAGLRENEV